MSRVDEVEVVGLGEVVDPDDLGRHSAIDPALYDGRRQVVIAPTNQDHGGDIKVLDGGIGVRPYLRAGRRRAAHEELSDVVTHSKSVQRSQIRRGR